MSADREAIYKAIAEAKVRRALELIEQAQNDLATACQELSAITHGCPMWKATSTMHDRVKALWYRVHNFRLVGKFGLDSDHRAVYDRREREAAATQ